MEPGGDDRDPITVYLVTAEPGDEIWERFGHNGIWIHDESTGQDIVWEWGLFSFQQPGFIGRLARGTMLYSMGGRYLEDMVAAYRRQNRSVWAQELALTPDQERELNRSVWENARPENADYVYDYYEDNCSTRVRDALDRVLDGQIRAATASVPTGATWRWHTRRLLRPDPLAEAGLQVVLGNPGDREISAWEEMFLPMRLREHLSAVSVRRPDGGAAPLVLRELQLVESTRAPEPTEPANRILWAALIGLILAAGVSATARAAMRGSAAHARLLGLFTGGWCLLLGGLGAILLLAWPLTDHDFWRWNENLLLANPLLLGGAFLSFPLLLGRAPGPRMAGLFRLVALGAGASILLKLLPWFGQGNWEIVLATLPVHVALAWGASGRPAPTP